VLRIILEMVVSLCSGWLTLLLKCGKMWLEGGK
jgi:hypothetical protein